MDFALTEAQHDLAGLTHRIVTDAAENATAEPHGSGGLDRTLWSKLASAGILDAGLPSSVGGGGFGLLEQCSVLIELGGAAAQVPFASCITAAASALAECGSAEHTEQWLLPVIRGKRLLTAVVPDAATQCGFTAEPADGGWRLRGSQTAVGAAAFADGFLLAADTPDGPGVFLVARDTPGFEITEQSVVDSADAGLVEAKDVLLAQQDLLEQPGGDLAERLRQRATVGYCAYQLGVLRQALHLTAEHANTRTQFDHVLGSFQAVRQRLADAYIDVEAVRLSLWQAAAQLASGKPAAEQVATAKFWASEAGHRVAHSAVHIHGGVGIDVDYPLHRYFVAAKRTEFALGGATAQLRALGEILA